MRNIYAAGVTGVAAMLAMAQKDHGKLPWKPFCMAPSGLPKDSE